MKNKSRLIKTPFDDLTYTIISCAMASHNALGPSLCEDSYQRDLEHRLSEKNIPFAAQQLFEVFGGEKQDALIGYYIPDFIVADVVVVEIKALPGLGKEHEAQVIGYLAVTGCPLGLMINFGTRRLEYHRILPPIKLQEHLVNHRWLFVPDWLRNKEE